jgi:hypothetical protein
VTTPVVSQLVDELVDRYQDRGVATLRVQVDSAIHDLTGSVHPDALAEMAMRLTMFRLEHDYAHGAAS